MSTYNFIKSVDIIKLRTEINSSVIGNTVNSSEFANNLLTIDTNKELSIKEYKILHEIVSNHSYIEDQIRTKILSAIAFGQSIIIEVGVENIMLGFTTSQITSMLVKFGALKGMLETGSLHTALAYVDTIKPDSLLPQWRIDKYKNKLKDYLGIK